MYRSVFGIGQLSQVALTTHVVAKPSLGAFALILFITDCAFERVTLADYDIVSMRS